MFSRLILRFSVFGGVRLNPEIPAFRGGGAGSALARSTSARHDDGTNHRRTPSKETPFRNDLGLDGLPKQEDSATPRTCCLTGECLAAGEGHAPSPPEPRTLGFPPAWRSHVLLRPPGRAAPLCVQCGRLLSTWGQFKGSIDATEDAEVRSPAHTADVGRRRQGSCVQKLMRN